MTLRSTKLKRWWASKTINFGLLVGIAGVVQIFTASLNNPVITLVIGVVIVVLRTKTDSAVGKGI